MAFRAPPVAPRTAAMHWALCHRHTRLKEQKGTHPAQRIGRGRVGEQLNVSMEEEFRRSAVRSIAARALLLTFGRQET